MFFEAKLLKELTLEPRFMGKKVREMVHERLKDAVEGKLVPNVGFVVTVLRITDDWMGTGLIDNLTGGSVYKVPYEAIVFRPFKNEVLDVIVTSVNNYGFQGSVGGMFKVFVHKSNMPMSNPEDPQKFEDEAWVSLDGSTQIKKDCGVRLRVITVKFHADRIDGVGNIKDHYCGLIFVS